MFLCFFALDLFLFYLVYFDSSFFDCWHSQINEFEGEGIAIGLSCAHINADPTSLSLLFKSWIETHRKETIEHPLSWKPYALCDRQVPRSFTKSTNYYAEKANAQPPSVKMATVTFKFSNSAVEKCLKEVHGKCPDATPFDLLTALFWIRIEHLKAQTEERKHALSICLDYRSLVQPPIPLGYFGNALHFSLLSLNEEEIDCNELGNVVELVHRHVSGIGEEEVRSSVEWLESQMEKGGKYASPFRMYGPELTCVSMEHMITGNKSLLHSASFKNDEKPVHVACHISNVTGEGLIMVLPSVEEGLARTVMVTLPVKEINKACEDQAILRLQPTVLLSGRQ